MVKYYIFFHIVLKIYLFCLNQLQFFILFFLIFYFFLMENEKKMYMEVFKNEEYRTKQIKELENYLNDTIKSIEIEWKENGEIPKNNNKYNEYTQKVIDQLQILNNDLRKICENSNDKFKNDINQLLSLEEANFKSTINIFIQKLNCFELISKDEDDYKVINKEKEIANLKQKLSLIREQINDHITNLKYTYL